MIAVYRKPKRRQSRAKGFGLWPARKRGAREDSSGASGRNARVVAIGAAVLLATILLLVGASMANSALGTSSLFSVREISMNRCMHVTKEDVSAAVGRNAWALSPEAAGKRLMAHQWVRAVAVRKILPDMVVVEIEERRPVALLNLDRLWYVDGDGTPFKPVATYDPKSLPILTGFTADTIKDPDGAPSAALQKSVELVALAEDGFFRQNLSEVHHDPSEGFTLVARDDGLTVKIGKLDFREALRRVEAVASASKGTAMQAKFYDVRVDGKIFLK